MDSHFGILVSTEVLIKNMYVEQQNYIAIKKVIKSPITTLMEASPGQLLAII